MDIPVLILYGSQTGNAQDVAERLAREAQLLLFRPRVLPMDTYDVTSLPNERLLLCVTSTTGQGDMPDNMRRFWKFLLRKSLPPDSLAHTQFAVFGLGDSGYPQFNVAAKKLARRLQALGAQPFCDLGLGDDQHPNGYEAALDVWAPSMWSNLRQIAGPLPTGVAQPILDASTLLQLGQSKYNVTLLPEQPQLSQHIHTGAHSSTSVKLHTANGTANGMNTSCSSDASCSSWKAAVAAGIAFRHVAAAAAGASDSLQQSGHTYVGVADGHDSRMEKPLQHSRDHPYFASVLVNRRLTAPSHFQDTRHIELDLGNSGITYKPGDVLAIPPRTPDTAVEALLTRLGLNGDQWLKVTPSGHSAGGQVATASTQCVTTIRSLIQGALDVAGASPRRYFFQVMAHFARTDMERERLQLFASAEGRDDLYRYCAREGRTVLEVLTDFPSVELSLEWLLEACPPLHPRLFSISSSNRMYPGRVHLTVALVEYKTSYNRRKRGLCSAYLAGLLPDSAASQAHTNGASNQALLPPSGMNGTGHTSAGEADVVLNHTAGQQHVSGSLDGQSATSSVAVWVEPGSLRLPPASTTPLILIGPGTGVAPFRSFLQDRLATQQGATQEDQRVAPSCLVFGCRGQHVDYYYEDEWKQMQAAGVLQPGPEGLITAFSRDQATKVYVTHRIREHGVALWALLQQGAWVYVSGSAQKMPAQVMSAFQDIVQEQGSMSKEDAAKYLRQFELSGRYQVEAWS